MLFLSDRFTSASGSIGGTTFSHNRFGLYTRARRVPVNPNTGAQQNSRQGLGSGSAAWRSLTEAQRDGWNVYAAATPTVNALGQTVFLTGHQQFVASFSLSNRLGAGVVTTAPVTPGRPSIGSPVVAITAAAGGSIAVTAIDAAIDNILGVFVGDPISAGVTFFAGPYQLVGSDAPAAGAITLTPVAGRNGLAFVVGQRIPYRLAALDAAFRLSTIASGIDVVA